MRTMRALLMGAVVAVVTTACSSPSSSTSTTRPGSSPTVTIGSTTSSAQVIVATLYADVLTQAGATVRLRTNLGPRDALEAALAAGQLDLYPDDAGSLLLFLTSSDSSVATQAAAAVGALKIILAPHGATVLDPAPAIDGDVFAVTRATATTYHLTTLSSLTAVAGQLVLGGPPACPQLPRCEPGLQNTYGMHFASFTALDDAGPITVSALQGGEVQVAELRSTDSSIVQHDFVVLADDRHLQPADNLVPVIRRSVDTPAIAGALNRLSARLTTAELAQLTRAVDIDGDPGAVALRWLRHEHLR